MTAHALLRACPQRDGCPLVSPRDLRRLDIAPRWRLVALAASVSLLAHMGAMAAFAPRDSALIAGGGEDAPAALGTAFADFAQGIITPSATEALPPERTEPIFPETAARPLPPSVSRQIAPAMAVPTAPVAETAILPMAPVPEAAAQQAPEQPPTPPDQIAEALTPNPAPTDLAPALAPDLAPETSRKPAPRPERSAPAPAPQGNAPQTATRGSQQNADGQSANAAPIRAQAVTQGNAAASNYPGEVLRRIQRTRQARSPARGQVLVAFRVDDRGALASLTVARSSGHPGLDQTALDHIRRAAPFPPPPNGAERQFSFEFVGR
jgi:periplasmic protein TonB